MRTALLLSLLLIACPGPDPVDDTPPEVLDAGTIEVSDVSAGTLERGVIHGYIAHLVGEEIDGQVLAAASVAVDNTTTGRADVRVVFSLDDYGDAVSREGFVPSGARTTFAVALPLDVALIGTLTEEVETRLTARVSVRGEPLAPASSPVRITPVHIVPWRVGDSDLRGLVTTLVTPDAPEVGELIAHAADFTPDSGIGGYEQSEAAVLEDVRGIYDAAADLGATFAPLPDGYFGEPQRVRRPSAAVSATDATVMDGVLLFAAALEAMGLDTYIAYASEDVWVVFRAEPAGALYALDVGGVGVVDFLTASGDGASGFDAASIDDPDFLFLSVGSMRSIGVVPFPGESG